MEQLKKKILDLVKKTKGDSKKESTHARYGLEYIFFPIFDCLCNIRASYGIIKDNIYTSDDVTVFKGVTIDGHWQKYATDWEYICFDAMHDEPDGKLLMFCSCGAYATIKLDTALDDKLYEKFAEECRRKVEDKIKQLKKYEEEAEEKLGTDYDSIVQKYRSINDISEDVK